VIECEAWLRDLSTKGSPGGVAAASMAAAMGAALMAKAVRVTLKHGSFREPDREFLEGSVALAQAQVAGLVELATADEKAVRAVLSLAAEEADSAAARTMWLEATTLPVQLGETCQLLLADLPRLATLCWSAVVPDLKAGGWLLEAGLKTGLLSAESNLRLMGEKADGTSLPGRIRQLQDGKTD
jgi:formiminotetrahydrofolate cyclodeaminase